VTKYTIYNSTEIQSVQPGKRLNLHFIIPIGLFETIYCWGVHLLQDYLQKTIPGLTIEVHRLNEDRKIAELQKEYQTEIGLLSRSLKREAVSAIYGMSHNEKVFFGLVVYLGSSWVRIAVKHKLIKRGVVASLTAPGFLARLDQLQSRMEDHLAAVLQLEPNETEAEPTPGIWALSVYDMTLFESLSLASLIKSKLPNGRVVMGGEHFDFENASLLIRQLPWIDAIVVGYGEEVTQKIVLDFINGNEISDLDYDGLVNRRFITTDRHERQVNIPAIYRDMVAADYLSFVKKGVYQDNTYIKVLTQRGCSWGKCSFCTELCKSLYYPVAGERLLAQLDAELRQISVPSGKLLISVDSDEIRPEMLISLLKYFSNHSFPHLEIDIYFWIQVKSFTREVAEALQRFNLKNVALHLCLNFESLNRGVLKTMRKGHLPLQALEAAKATQDCGFTILTNYFLHFPLENLADIQDEIQLLENSLHILVPPWGEIEVFPYCGNFCDAVYREQEKYQAVIRKLREDVWNREVFGVDLPFSIWSCSYRERFGWNPEKQLRWSYRQIVNSFGTSKNGLYLILHYLTALFTGKNAYVKRFEILECLGSMSEQKYSPAGGAQKSPLHIPRFFIEDGVIVQDYNAPFAPKRWSQKLDDFDLQMLRFLYWKRKPADIYSRFLDRMGESKIEEILSRHVKLGSILRSGDHYLCIAHDPEYWETETDRGD
jgi:hypothetical protein